MNALSKSEAVVICAGRFSAQACGGGGTDIYDLWKVNEDTSPIARTRVLTATGRNNTTLLEAQLDRGELYVAEITTNYIEAIELLFQRLIESGRIK